MTSESDLLKRFLSLRRSSQLLPLFGRNSVARRIVSSMALLEQLRGLQFKLDHQVVVVVNTSARMPYTGAVIACCTTATVIEISRRADRAAYDEHSGFVRIENLALASGNRPVLLAPQEPERVAAIVLCQTSLGCRPTSMKTADFSGQMVDLRPPRVTS